MRLEHPCRRLDDKEGVWRRCLTLWRREEAFNTSPLARRRLFGPDACWRTQHLPRPLQRLARANCHHGRTVHIQRRTCGPWPAPLLPPKYYYFSNVFVLTFGCELSEADAGAEGSNIAGSYLQQSRGPVL